MYLVENCFGCSVRIKCRQGKNGRNELPYQGGSSRDGGECIGLEYILMMELTGLDDLGVVVKDREKSRLLYRCGG